MSESTIFSPLKFKRRSALGVAALALCVLAACNGGDSSKTPPPTATVTPTPNSVILPEVQSGDSSQVSPLTTPDANSPLPSPTPTP